MLLRTISFVTVGVLLSGCTALSDHGGNALPACQAPEGTFFPAVDSALVVEPNEWNDVLAFFPGSDPPKTVEARAPPNWKWDLHTLSVPGTNGTLLKFSVKPPLMGTGSKAGAATPPMGPGAVAPVATYNWTTSAPGTTCKGTSVLNAKWIVQPIPGRVAAAGKAAYVHYAGLWPNGTVFDTNIKAIDENPSFPKAGWYEWGSADALPVYIYDQQRTEAPQYWNTQSNPLPKRDSAPWMYYTTIKGFNDGLKGMAAPLSPSPTARAMTRTVFIPPEKAYTYPGNEKHILYGDSLVFFITLDDVVDTPCATSLPNHNTCHTPSTG